MRDMRTAYHNVSQSLTWACVGLDVGLPGARWIVKTRGFEGPDARWSVKHKVLKARAYVGA
mgnify:CR=1 FL=1